MQDGDTSFPLHSPRLDTTRRTDHSPDPSIAIGSHNQLLQRLISHTVPQDELCSLIETIFSDRKATDVIDHLRGSDTQAFIDVVGEVCHHTLYFRMVLFRPYPFCLLGIR